MVEGPGEIRPPGEPVTPFSSNPLAPESRAKTSGSEATPALPSVNSDQVEITRASQRTLENEARQDRIEKRIFDWVNPPSST